MPRKVHDNDSAVREGFRELTMRQKQLRGDDRYCFPSEECRRELFRWVLDHGEPNQTLTRFFDGILIIIEIEVMRRLALAKANVPGPDGREGGDGQP